MTSYRDHMRQHGMRPGDRILVLLEHLDGPDTQTANLTTTTFYGTVSDVHDTILDRILRTSHFWMNGDIRVTEKQPKDGSSDGRGSVSIWPCDDPDAEGARDREPGGIPTDPYDVQPGQWVEVYRQFRGGAIVINWGRVTAADPGWHFTLADNTTVVYDEGALRAPVPTLDVNIFPEYAETVRYPATEES